MSPITCQLASNTSLNCWYTAIVIAKAMLHALYLLFKSHELNCNWLTWPSTCHSWFLSDFNFDIIEHFRCRPKLTLVNLSESHSVGMQILNDAIYELIFLKVPLVAKSKKFTRFHQYRSVVRSRSTAIALKPLRASFTQHGKLVSSQY